MELQVLTARMAALLSVSFAIILPSCEERININTDASEPRPVIYGYITTDTMRHSVSITRSSDYFSTAAPEGISGAAVVIRQGEESYSMTESTSEPGVYQTDSMAGQVGRTYTLHVTMDFDGDGQAEEYTAESMLPPVSQLDSIAVQKSAISNHHLEVLVWGRLPEQEENHFNFRLYRNNVIVNDSLQGFSVGDDSFIQRKTIEGIPAFYLSQERESSTLAPGDLITLQIDGITSEYAGFINDAQSERRGSIPMFGGPPANVETNIRSLSGIRASGFFSAYSINRVSMYYKP
jgi:hypothetical protein